MTTPAHRKLAEKLHKPPLKTVINEVLLEMLALLFSEEEAALAAQMPLMPATAEKIARRAHRPTIEAQRILDDLARRGLIFSFGQGPDGLYALMPVAPGIFEAQMSRAPRDEKARRFAELFEAYYVEENYRELLKHPVAMAKVVPVGKTVSHQIGVTPGDLIREAIDRHSVYSLAYACSCRHHKELVGEGCDRPRDVCMAFGPMAEYTIRFDFGRQVSKEEILEAVDRAEAAGLVHITDNLEFPSFSCNCCACCCGFLAILNKFNIPGIFANSRFLAEFDTAACNSCGKCARACPVGAVRIYNKKRLFESWRCIGCGVCVPACQKQKAIKLVLRPQSTRTPENYGQLITAMGFQYLGLKDFTDVAPGFVKFLGNRLQSSLFNK